MDFLLNNNNNNNTLANNNAKLLRWSVFLNIHYTAVSSQLPGLGASSNQLPWQHKLVPSGTIK